MNLYIDKIDNYEEPRKLMLPWSYVPDNSQLESCWKAVRKYYPENLQELFREAVQINRDAVKRHQEYNRLQVRAARKLKQCLHIKNNTGGAYEFCNSIGT